MKKQDQRNSYDKHRRLGIKDVNPLDGCLHVYLDVGSNIGVQVRKLFEPQLFPDAPVLKIFDQHFGEHLNRNLSQVCSVGFEPNPIHYQILQKISSSYKNCGWRAIFYEVGVSFKNDILSYARINGPQEWGGFIVEKKDDFGDKLKADINDKMVENVHVIRLATFILEIVNTRKLPESAKTTLPQVVMKLDIEGKEVEVLPDLLISGALGSVDKTFVEWHGQHKYVSFEDTAIVRAMVDTMCRVAEEKHLLQRCNIQKLDDETYFNFTGSLPTCT